MIEKTRVIDITPKNPMQRGIEKIKTLFFFSIQKIVIVVLISLLIITILLVALLGATAALNRKVLDRYKPNRDYDYI